VKNVKTSALLLLILVLMLAACGGEEANTETTTEENTTQTETAEEDTAQVEEAQPETTIEMAEEVRVEEGGFAFQPPAGYEVSVDYVIAELAAADAPETQINLFGSPLMEGMSLDVMYESFTSEMGSDETVTLGEREDISVNELNGFSVTMAGDEEGVAMKGKLIAVGNDTQAVFVLAVAEESNWDNTVAEQIDAMVNTLSLFEIVTPDDATEETDGAEVDTVEETEEEVSPSEVNIDTVFPVLDDATNPMGEGGESELIYQTSSSIEEAAEFYRAELTAQGLTEREIVTVIDESVFSLVFDGSENGKAVVIQGVDLGDMVNITVRFEEI
jgi:hypothetical protein